MLQPEAAERIHERLSLVELDVVVHEHRAGLHTLPYFGVGTVSPCVNLSMLHQFLFILTSTRQPTSVVLSTDTAQFSRAVVPLSVATNPRDTQVRKHGARFQHSSIAQRATHVRIAQSGQSKAEACEWWAI